MTGYVLRRSETDYLVGCDSEGHGGYNVVPKAIDAFNAYDIAEVEAYISEHPEMLLDSQALALKELAKQARARRDNLLKTEVDAMNPMRWEALTEEQKEAWRAYRQALLDVPQQEGFPTSIIWPEVTYDK